MSNVSSSKSTQVLFSENLSSDGALIVPSRLPGEALRSLVQLLSGRNLCLVGDANASFDEAQKAAIAELGLPQISIADEEGRREIDQHIRAGGLAIFVPGQAICLPGTAVIVPTSVLEELLRLGQPVQPLFVEAPRKTLLSVAVPAHHKEWAMAFGKRVAPGEGLPAFWESILLAAEGAFSERPTFNGHLGRYLVRGLKKHGGRGKIVDGDSGKTTSYAKVFAAALALAGEIKKLTKQPRVAIVLPPGPGALIANLAVVLAGKVPVNLNFTAGKEAVDSAIKQSEVDRFITADIFVRKVQGFPWPALKNLIFIERLLPQIKPRIVWWALASKILPAGVICSMLGLPAKGGDDEAALLFTSGSSGEPKGVVLSHRNILANVNQFSARINMHESDKILACLPLFHSFGCTVTLWYPLLEGLSLVSYPKPNESVKLAELVEQHAVTLLLSTPTFLRGFLKRVKREQLATLKLVVTGAEKLPLSVEEEFRKRFGKAVMEGYGLTETSPATNVNLPDPEPDSARPGLPIIPSRRLGSVGQFLPGVAVRITDCATNEPLPVDQSGMIWLRGANIFRGYLKQPRRTEEVLQGKWFRTGDIGRLDGEGFLYIEGRLSRFSKIGGEMVPHETVEDHINKALELDGETERKIAVVGVPDTEKGEALVLLSTVAGPAVKQELIKLRYTLLDRGVPALWIPKRLVPVEHIPVLASGKLDIKGCEKIAARAE